MVNLKAMVLDHRFQTVAVLAIILLTAAGSSMMTSEPEGKIDTIIYDRQETDVKTTHRYDVRAANGTYRYTMKEPETGSRCGTVAAGPACEEPTEPGFKTIESYLEEHSVANSTRSDTETVYHPPDSCIEHANETHLVLETCEQG